ncbi:Tigger transposable element-derived protein 4 [Eumeta japonica]|uniref:Tigger transposable element-derived protein 4 n=1 Tax=Eumeta variegata TaxID=151549 RepID=A0A4C1SGN0_EUMVA|nr:Tigger transposable element-derived protein 4 [Eumeta japonica]
MSVVKRKLKILSIAEKVEALEAVKSYQKKKNVAEQFGPPRSIRSTILKNESDIMKKIQNGQTLSCKRQRIAEFPGLEECLLKWFEQCRSQNISVSGPLLQEKAEMYSKSLGLANFRNSNGWLEKFKRRHELVFKKFVGKVQVST